MRAIIAVALHRDASVPSAPPYLPVQAGAALQPDLGFTRDDTGENISARNPQYCELTAHYWIWKNADAQACGLCHYRRYFVRRRRQMLTQADLDALLADVEVLVPRPRLYLIETNWSHYAHAHRESDLHALRAVIGETCPDFLPSFDRVMKRRWGRRFNMFIMRKEAFMAYSAWLFGVLFTLEERLGENVPPRTMGFIAERLMDVWLDHTRPRFRQLPVLHTEGQHWPTRIAAFLRRKFTYGKQ